jgi:hypothetical protein
LRSGCRPRKGGAGPINQPTARPSG